MSRRPGRLYLFEVYDPYALLYKDLWGRPAPRLKVVPGYLGQTRRKVETRWREHELGTREIRPKIWADTIVKRHKLREWSRISDWWLDTRESVAVVKWRPRYNISLNMANPKRIPPWEAVRLRAERDRLGGTEHLVALAKQQQRSERWWRREQLVGGIKLKDGVAVSCYGPMFECQSLPDVAEAC